MKFMLVIVILLVVSTLATPYRHAVFTVETGGARFQGIGYLADGWYHLKQLDARGEAYQVALPSTQSKLLDFKALWTGEWQMWLLYALGLLLVIGISTDLFKKIRKSKRETLPD